MEQQSGSGRWNPNNGSYKQLRAPKVSNPPLSVNAPEFVPKSFRVHPQQQQHQQQQQHLPAHLNRHPFMHMPEQHPQHVPAHITRAPFMHMPDEYLHQQQHFGGYDHEGGMVNHAMMMGGGSGSGGGGGVGGGGGGGNESHKPSVQDRIRNHQISNTNFNAPHHNHKEIHHHHQQQPYGAYSYDPNVVNHHPMIGGGGGGGFSDKGSLTNRIRNIQIAPQHHYNDVEENNKQISETETVALDYLTEVITKLYNNPGMFETYQKKLKDMFMELKNNHFVMSNAVEMLFEQSINEQNFRYMGAKLCHLLDNLDDSAESVFRNLLHMKMEYQQVELVTFMQNEQRKVRGATLFLAELFVQLRKPHDVSRNHEIAMWILSAIHLLLKKQGPENVKCVCQTLKLCGYELDMDRPNEMVSLSSTLTEVAGISDVQTERLVKSVLELKGKQWGREEIVTQPVPDQVSQVYNDSPVFYGPDGEILTEEENSFLETNTPSFPNMEYDDFDDDDPDELVDDDDDDGIDLEMKLAFKDFVQGAKTKKH